MPIGITEIDFQGESYYPDIMVDKELSMSKVSPVVVLEEPNKTISILWRNTASQRKNYPIILLFNFLSTLLWRKLYMIEIP